MLLDIGSVVGGIALAVVGFVVVILVCVVTLRLLAAILPSYQDGHATPSLHDPEPEVVPSADAVAPAADAVAPAAEVVGEDPSDPQADAGAVG